MSFCPSKDIHSVYLDGELPENYKAEYELHISHCEKCRKELEQLKALRSLFKADSDSLNLDQHFMDESFQRLQIKMAYSRNVGKAPQKSPFKVISYVASGVAAAAVLALVLPLGLKSNKANASQNVAASPLIQSVNSVSTVPITAVSTNCYGTVTASYAITQATNEWTTELTCANTTGTPKCLATIQAIPIPDASIVRILLTSIPSNLFFH